MNRLTGVAVSRQCCAYERIRMKEQDLVCPPYRDDKHITNYITLTFSYEGGGDYPLSNCFWIRTQYLLLKYYPATNFRTKYYALFN